MKKVILIIGIIAIAGALGTYLNQSKQTETFNQNQTKKSTGQDQPDPTAANSYQTGKPELAESTDNVIKILQAEADNEAQVSSELEVDSSSFDAEIIETNNIENAYEANKF